MVIEEGITSISENMFIDHTTIKTISIPSTTSTIGNYILRGCLSLTTISISDGNAAYSSDANGVMYDKEKTTIIQYPLGKEETNYQIPTGVTTIKTYAFEKAQKLETLEIKNSVVTVETEAFESIPNLKTVSIGTTIQSIGQHAFRYCNKLESFTVDENNEGKYRSVEGVLIQEHTLIQYPHEKKPETYIIEEGITTIAGYAFYQNPYVDYIKFNDDITTIQESAFSGVSKVRTITLPSTVGAIETDSFKEMKELAIVVLRRTSDITCSNVFDSETTFKIYVMKESIEATLCGKTAENTIEMTQTAGEYVDFITTTKGELIVYGKDEMKNYDNTENIAPWKTTQTSISSLKIDERVTSIGNYAFNGITIMTTVLLPTTLISIGSYSFQSTGITTISIPTSVTTIGLLSFNKCSQLTEIKVAEENTAYCDVDGILFDEKKETIIAYPIGKTGETYSIPENTKTIEQNAFEQSKLKTIVVPLTTERINSMAFTDCLELTNVEYPNSKITFNTDIFKGSNKLVTLKIYGEGAMQSYPTNGHPWYEVREQITKVTFNSGITTVGEYAFEGTKGMKTIEWNDITTINNYAFTGSGIEELTITEKISSIRTMAFASCSELSTMKYPIQEIIFSADMLYSCSKFHKIEIYGDGPMQTYTHQNQPWYAVISQIDEIVIGSTIDTIGDYAFEGTEKLVSVNLQQIQSIGINSFATSGLTSIEIPTTVTTIKSNAFLNCVNLESVKYPTSVSEHNPNIFEGCSSMITLTIYGNGEMKDYTSEDNQPWKSVNEQITTVTIENTVTKLGTYSFAGFNKIVEITIPTSVTTLGTHVFDGCTLLNNVKWESTEISIIPEYTFSECTSLKSFTIPSTISTIKSNAFISSGITEITIPSNVQVIESQAFKTCRDLTVLKYPTSSTLTCDNQAFEGCTSLKRIEIYGEGSMPDYSTDKQPWYALRNIVTTVSFGTTVSKVGNYAFYECTTLTTIELNNFSEIGEQSFAKI